MTMMANIREFQLFDVGTNPGGFEAVSTRRR
jgi:hypothetical protein